VTDTLKRVEYSEGKGFVSSTDEILEDLRNGKMVVLVDAEDRENEGDLVIPAQMATPDAINFMARFGRGLICLALTEERADALRLEAMARTNRTRMGTAFTVSIEAKDGISTGISAADRSHTVRTAIDPSKDHRDLVSPGHVFPLVARDGGVLVRTGHTEASVDLARMAGLTPAGVICEIMNDDGTMARMPDLVAFAQRHGLKIGTIEDLVAHRLRHDRIVTRVAETDVDSAYGGTFRMVAYETTVDAVQHLALVRGDLSAPGPVLVRVHAVDPAADLLGIGRDAEQPTQIARAMEQIAAEGRGVVVVIRDLRPKAVSQWIETKTGDGAAVTPIRHRRERRQVEIGIGSQILRDLSVRDMVVLSNSAGQSYVGLEGHGLRIVGTRKIG
jgi:3,4-dihydroxy 2-butanone 4-phosphate synthase/GTP cyclohydrolase II